MQKKRITVSYNPYLTKTRPYRPYYPQNGIGPPRANLPEPYLEKMKRTMAKAKVWLIAPALVGTGVALGVSLSPDAEKGRFIRRFGGAAGTKLAINVYTGAAVFAVAACIFFALRETADVPILSLLPLGFATSTAIVFFASVYNLMHELFPGSFKGDIGEEVTVQLFSFLYLSMTTLSTGGLGDIVPLFVSTRMLVSMEVLFNLFVLTVGISLFGELCRVA